MCEGTAGCVPVEAGPKCGVWKVKQDYGRMCEKAGTSHTRELRNFAKEPSDPLRYFTVSLPFYDYVLCDTLNRVRSEQLALLVQLLATHIHALCNEGAHLGAGQQAGSG